MACASISPWPPLTSGTSPQVSTCQRARSKDSAVTRPSRKATAATACRQLYQELTPSWPVCWESSRREISALFSYLEGTPPVEQPRQLRLCWDNHWWTHCHEFVGVTL